MAMSGLQTVTCNKWLCDSCVKTNQTNRHVFNSDVTGGVKDVVELSGTDSAKRDETKISQNKSDDSKTVGDSLVTCRKEIVQKNVERLKAKLRYVQTIANRITTAQQDIKKRKGDICLVLEKNLKTTSEYIHQCTKLFYQCTSLLNAIQTESDTKLEELSKKHEEVERFVEEVNTCVLNVDQSLNSMSDSSIQFIQNAYIGAINSLRETEITIESSLLDFDIGYESKESDNAENGELDIGVLTINNKSLQNILRTIESDATQEQSTSEEAHCNDPTCSACVLDLQISVSPDLGKTENSGPKKCTDTVSATSLVVTESELSQVKTNTDNRLSTHISEQIERSLLKDENPRNKTHSDHVADNDTTPAITKQIVSAPEVPSICSISDCSNQYGFAQNLQAFQHGDVVRYRRQSDNETHSPIESFMCKSGTNNQHVGDKRVHVQEDTGGQDGHMQIGDRPNKFLNPYVNLCPRAVCDYKRSGVIISGKHCANTGTAVVTDKAKDTMELSEYYFSSPSEQNQFEKQLKEKHDEIISDQDLVKRSANNDTSVTGEIKDTVIQTSPLPSETPRQITGYEYVLIENQDTLMDRSNNINKPVCSDMNYDESNKPHGSHSETNATLSRENRNGVIYQDGKSIDNKGTINKSNATVSISMPEGHAVLLNKLDKRLTKLLYSCLTRNAKGQQGENKKQRSTQAQVIKRSRNNTLHTPSVSDTVDGNNKLSADKSVLSNKPKSVMVVSPSLYNSRKERQKSGAAINSRARVENEEPNSKRRRTKSAVQASTQRKQTHNKSSERHAELLAQNFHNPRFSHIPHQMLSDNPRNNHLFGHPAMLDNVNHSNEMFQKMERQREFVNFMRGTEVNVDQELTHHFNTNRHYVEANRSCPSEINNGARNDTSMDRDTNMNVPHDTSKNASEFHDDREAILSLYGSEEVTISNVPSTESQGNMIYSRALDSYLEESGNTQTLINDTPILKSTESTPSRIVPTSTNQPAVDIIQTAHQQCPIETYVPLMRNPDTSRHLPYLPYRDVPCHPPVSSYPRIVSYRGQLPHLHRLLDTSAPPPLYPGVPHQARASTFHNGSHAQNYNNILPNSNEVSGDAIKMLESPPNSEGRRHTDVPPSSQHGTEFSKAMPQYQNDPHHKETTHQPTDIDCGDTEGRPFTFSRIASQSLDTPSCNPKDKRSAPPNKEVPWSQNTQSIRGRSAVPVLYHHVPSGYRNIRPPLVVSNNQNVFRRPPYSYISRRQDLQPHHTIPLHENTPPCNIMPRFSDIPISQSSSRQNHPSAIAENKRQGNASPCPDLDALRTMFAKDHGIAQARTRTSPKDRLTSPIQTQVPQLTSPIQRQVPQLTSPIQRQVPQLTSPIQRRVPHLTSPIQRQVPQLPSPIQRQAPQLTRFESEKEQPSFTLGQFNEAYAAIQSSFVQQQSRLRHARQTENIFTEITNQLWNQKSPSSNNATSSKGKADSPFPDRQ